MASGVTVLKVAVLMNTWSTCADLAIAGKAGHPAPSMRKLGENTGESGWKMTWGVVLQSIRAALVDFAIFWFMLVVSLGLLVAHSLPPGGGERVGPLVQQ